MSSKQQREQQKTLLLRQIQQQRLDLIASRRDWLEATALFDRGWQTLQHLRSGQWSAAVSWQYGPFATRASYCAGLNAALVSGAPAHGKTPAAPDIILLNALPSTRPSSLFSFVPGRQCLVTGTALGHHSSR